MRRVALIFFFGLLAATVVVGAGAWLAARAMTRALDPQEWTATALDRHQLPRMFGVRLSESPRRFEGRRLEGGDARFEALVWFEDRAQLERFVADNHLGPVDAGALEFDADPALERLEGGKLETVYALESPCCTGVAAVVNGRAGLALWLQATERSTP